MKRFNKLFFSFLLSIICMLCVCFNVRAEETDVQADNNEWTSLVENFKNSEKLEEIRQQEGFKDLQITNDDKELVIKLYIDDKAYETKYAYESGIVSYEKAGDKFAEYTYNEIILNYFIEKFDYKYNGYKFYKYIYNNDNLTIEEDGIEFKTELLYTEEELKENSKNNGQENTEDSVGFQNLKTFVNFKLNILTGVKGYDESKIAYYEFISGQNQKYTVDKENELSFKIEADSSLFKEVYLNDKLLDSSNYTVESGSTIIVLKKEYLDKLNNGIHSLRVYFNDGEFAETTFVVEKTVENPSTGVGIGYTIFCILIIISLTTYFLVKKNSRFPKHN